MGLGSGFSFAFGMAVGSCVSIGILLAAHNVGAQVDAGQVADFLTVLVALWVGLMSVSVARETQKREARNELKQNSLAVTSAYVACERLRGLVNAHGANFPRKSDDVFFDSVVESCESISRSEAVIGFESKVRPSDLPHASAHLAIMIRERVADFKSEVEHIGKDAKRFMEREIAEKVRRSSDVAEVHKRYCSISRVIDFRLRSALDRCKKSLDEVIQTLAADGKLLNPQASFDL